MLLRIKSILSLRDSSDKTILFVDTSADEESLKSIRTDPNFVVLDARKVSIELGVEKHSLVDSLEHCRRHLVNSMRTGRVLVIRLGPNSTDFLATLNDSRYLASGGHLASSGKSLSFFPLELFQQSGNVLRDRDWCVKLFRREDRPPKGTGPAECHPNFKVIVTTTLDPEHIDEALFNGSFGLPDKSYFEIIDL